LTIYAMAIAKLDGAIPQTLYLDYLVNTSEPRVVKLETTRARHQFYAVEERVKAAERAVLSKSFMPANPTDWFCCAKYCEFHSICSYV